MRVTERSETLVSHKRKQCHGKEMNQRGSHIRKRKDGRWEGRYTAGHDPETSRAIYKNVLGRTPAEAKAKLKAAIAETKSLYVTKTRTYTVGAWMDEWFKNYYHWASVHQRDPELRRGRRILHRRRCGLFLLCRPGNHVGILIKSAPREKMIPYILPVHTEDIYWLRSDSETTSIRNQFLDDKHERRSTTALAQGSTITVAELPEGISAKIYQLMKGDYEDDIIKVLAQRGKVALDMQGYLRVPDSSTKEMVYHDWDRKQEYFPHITYLKTDAAEAEILTGTSDRREAARLMVEWGVKEALITHNTEVLVYDGKEYYTCPLKPLGLAGRTGRGDTTFSAYITERERADIPQALAYASQLVSLKMQTPGPFKGDRADVASFADKYYH